MKTIEVVAAIIKRDNKILATQRGYGDFAGGWEFPGGKMEPNETPEVALIREIKEELTVNVSVQSFITTVEHQYDSFHLTMHCYVCMIDEGEINLLEHSQMLWLDADHLDEVSWLPADVAVVKAIKQQHIIGG
jgi:8-oxo-dGTP diphosphatase